MPETDLSFGRSLLSLRRDQVHLMDPTEPMSMEVELDSFQRQVAEKFIDLNASANDDELLSLEWIGKLLDSFLCCQEEFRVIIFNHKSQLLKQPMDRLIEDYFERSVKALDVCNAIRDGIELIGQWQKLIEIVICALDASHGQLGEGEIHRAKKALIDLAIGMLDEKDSSNSLAQRNRSFTRNKDNNQHTGYLRSLSWSVSRSWSAAKQLQGIGNNLATPRASDVIATNGLALTVYTMTSILLFVMWVLVAAIPCQDRGLQVHFYFPRHFQWAVPVMSLHDKIMDESKKRDKKKACGLLKEINLMEKNTRMLSELIDSDNFSLTDDNALKVKERVEELMQVRESMKEGLDPFERKVRDVFHRIVRSRTEALDSLGKVLDEE
ncbi:hypothetical protein F2Q70_00038494 [Brassica cretica]|uniref:BnaCnng15560D protein n=7 Tax=Brassica TaxID=3705 RepID=A0A078IAE5_BRANA|nr:PREDICTED: uncharacterized protein LOC106311147 [Brassica oleracea var. oleracea]XP_048622148.1 protein ROH1-like [Brassica napus]KAF2588380.1 hypothetical protein F2Q70_00038494 [Brassica cretica]KAG2255487.1 hypothetical protein Bca52824_074781 [Brassica carinata]VDD54362.1 unnamed protein product [Brassica oleracea]KAF2619392.1 hypothetical protein F2Q68_00039127 [Brassica cretica]KAF3496621.1 hypothetical protein DY000_02052774 [Brassica cretica]